jgi:amino-acid N-acetyltransferase
MKMGTIRVAEKEDFQKLKEFLQDGNVSANGMDHDNNVFFIVENEQNELLGALGIDFEQSVGLLRSFVIKVGMNDIHLFSLFERVFQYSKQQAIETVVLATDKLSVLPIFQGLGFEWVEKEQLPSALQSMEHGRSLLEQPNRYWMKRDFS